MAEDPNADPELPRSFFVISRDPRKDARATVDSLLSDGLMGLLALLLLPIILVPLFVALPASVLGFLEAGDIVIVLFFIVEYLAKLYLAQDRAAHFRDPWHLLDLAVVVISVVTYLPFTGLPIHGSWPLLLRLLRLPRALAVGARAVNRSATETAAPDDAASRSEGPETIESLTADLSQPPRQLTWEQVAPHVVEETPEWINLECVGASGIRKLSQLLRVPEPHFKREDVDEVAPHVHRLERMSFLFLHAGEVSFPQQESQYMSIEREGLVVICAGPTILTVSPHRLDMVRQVLPWLKNAPPAKAFTIEVLYGLLTSSLEAYRKILGDIEADLGRIGRLPRSRLPKDYLERMYAMRREMARLASTLVHFKEMFQLIDSQRLPLHGFDDTARENFRLLEGDVEYLSELADEVTERVQMDVDLYINQEAFETNRMLKVLAVITGLALVPAVMGGIFGMNLLGQPYPLDLWQAITAMILTVMFLIYCFIKLGWLKT